MVEIAPVSVQQVWFLFCLDHLILGQFCQTFSLMVGLSTSYPRPISFELEVVAVVITTFLSLW